MRIDILCPSGSPVGIIPDDIHGRGVGGAELALMTWAEVMQKRGHQVSIYNSPKRPGSYEGVEYYGIGEWDPNVSRDMSILFRNPHPSFGSSKGLRVFWSCDQFTEGDYNRQIFPFADRVVTISPFHTNYFLEHYKVEESKIRDIPLGVRAWEYNEKVEKIRNRFIFCSVPHRGLHLLRGLWNGIVSEFPDASLVITSDYRLWGSSNPDNHTHRADWSGVQNVQFLGKVSRKDLIRYQQEAELLAYPCVFDELFCIAVAECQVAGVIPLTSGVGALPSTNITGVVLPGDPRTEDWRRMFLDIVLGHLRNRDIIEEQGKKASAVARAAFDWNTIALLWENLQ